MIAEQYRYYIKSIRIILAVFSEDSEAFLLFVLKIKKGKQSRFLVFKTAISFKEI